jgi:NADH:ubiquinone reductase (H+-translocating)
VTTADGKSYQGDFLVLAAGSQANFFGTAGAKENAFPLYSIQDAQRLRSRILTAFEDSDREPKHAEQGGVNFVIIGGGPTGVEMAGSLADMIRLTMAREYTDLAVKHAQVYLIDYGHALLGAFSEGAHDYASRVLHKKGVIVRLGIGVKEVAPESRATFRRHFDSNTHSDLGRRVIGFSFVGKCRATARAWRTD